MTSGIAEPDSLKKRYLFKLGTNFVSIPIALATQAIIPRGLGPGPYGDFNFLTYFFLQIVHFFDTGTSLSLYTKLSKRPKEYGLIRFYWGFFGIVCVLIILFASAVFLANGKQLIWVGQEAKYIWMALFWGLLFWLSQILYKMVDAYGLTVKGESIKITQKVIGLCLLASLFFLGKLELTVFFIYHFIMFALLLISWGYILIRHNVKLFPRERLSRKDIVGYTGEFYQYSMPLVTYALVAMLTLILERWILQKYGGSIEQGYYSLSYQIGALCFLFTSAMTQLFIREISIAHGKEEIEKIRSMFLRFAPMFYSIALSLGAFFFFQAEKISLIMGGEKFSQAAIPIMIMALYPIHQTYGQLTGAVFLATDKTKLYRNINVTVMIPGLLVTFFLLAPKEYMGLDLGAVGLAIKMVALQFIAVNIQLWYNTRFLHISYLRLAGHQILAMMIIGLLSWLSAVAGEALTENMIGSLIASGAAYALLLSFTLFAFPSIYSLTREELRTQYRALKAKITSKVP